MNKLERQMEDLVKDLEARKQRLEREMRGRELAATIAAFVSGTDRERADVLHHKSFDRTYDEETRSALRAIAGKLDPFCGI